MPFANQKITDIIKDMNDKEKHQKDVKIFHVFLFFFLILVFISFILSLTGYFYKWIIIFLLLFIFSAAVFYFKAKKVRLSASREFIAVSTGLAIFAIGLSFFATPSVFSGRDQGSISEAAIRLAQNHELKFSNAMSEEFFHLYGAGKALNFPGFYYTENGNLITQFPLPYIAWLGAFYLFFGLKGLIIANSILFLLFLLSFYFLSRIFLEKIPSIISSVTAATSFSFFWFNKFTLSENLVLALLWISILELLIFIKSRRTSHFYLLLLSTFLLFFTRIEGIAFFAVIWAVLLAVKETRKFLLERKQLVIVFFAVFLLVFTFNLLTEMQFYKEITKGILLSGSQSPFSNIFKIYLIYGILQFLVLGTIGVFYLARKKEHLALIPFFVILPSFIYFFDPHISSDHPWMLRRLAFSILPALILYSVLFLYFWLYKAKKEIFYVAVLVLILLNIPLFVKYAFFSENKDVLAQTQNLSENFGSVDLILVDRLVSGDGWAMITGPMSFLYGKQAVYFFNPDDLGKINTKKFNNIFLIAPRENIEFYQNSSIANKLEKYKDYMIETKRLDIKSAPKLPEVKNIEIQGTIYKIK